MVEQIALDLDRKTNSPAPNREPSQVDIILEYLEAGNSLTDSQCRDLFGFTRLSHIAWKIRARIQVEGRRLVTEEIEVPTRHGKPARVGRYYLPDRTRGGQV